MSTIVAVLSSRCPPRCPLLRHIPLSSTKLVQQTNLLQCLKTLFKLDKNDPFKDDLLKYTKKFHFKCNTALFNIHHCGCPLLPMSSSLSSPYAPPAVLWAASPHTPSCPLSVRHSCCPLLPLSSPSVVRSSYEIKQKPAKHCSSPFHLTPSFTLYTLPLSSSDSFAHPFYYVRQRRHFEKSETGSLPLSSSDRFYPSFLIYPKNRR